MRKFRKDLVFFFITFLGLGSVIGWWFELWSALGFLKIVGLENFPKQKGKINLASNHPYKGEHFILYGLFYRRQYAFRPKLGPWSIAARENFGGKWFTWAIEGRLILADRPLADRVGTDSESQLIALEKLTSGGNLISYPEGGRTPKGTGEIKVDGDDEEKLEGKHFLVSKTGRKIRRLKNGGVRYATEVPGVVTVVAWFEFVSLFNMKLVIAPPRDFYNKSKREVKEEMEKIFLETADKAA